MVLGASWIYLLVEAPGVTPIEATAFGTPIVISRILSLTEISVDAALRMTPRSAADLTGAMLGLLADTELRRTFRWAGTRRPSRFMHHRTTTLILRAFDVDAVAGARSSGVKEP